jgi:Glycosyl transferase family 2
MDQTTAMPAETSGIYLSIGVIAWNEERNIARTLASVFGQTLFERLDRRKLRCELLCLANGCTDDTVPIAARTFEEQSRQHPFRQSFVCRALDLRERGKPNAWDVFVHRFSAPAAQYLILMDADIVLEGPNTLANLVATLEEDPGAYVATDQPRKHIVGKPGQSLVERLSLRAAELTQAAEGQLCGQLYCIRSGVARRIYLPKDLGSCEDGFIKAIVCTDFLTSELVPSRIRQVPEASHTFEAYLSWREVLKNQKRQMMSQAILHVLVDGYLRTLSFPERLNLAQTLQKLEREDPVWLKRLITAHACHTRFFWRLIPGLAAVRFKRLARLPGARRVLCLPAAVAGSAVSLASCFLAHISLRSGQTQYWPHAKSGMPERGGGC